jgi:hypothetical protein
VPLCRMQYQSFLPYAILMITLDLILCVMHTLSEKDLLLFCIYLYTNPFVSVFIILFIFLAYFPYFEKIKLGL